MGDDASRGACEESLLDRSAGAAMEEEAGGEHHRHHPLRVFFRDAR